MQSNQDNNFEAVELAITAKPTKEMLENVSSNSAGSPDLEKADIQFYNYCSALERCGAEVVISSDITNLDVNKSAVITDSYAIMGNFDDGCEEQESKKAIADILASKRFLKFISNPGLLDARDVLRANNQYFIALSDNTNEEGAMQLAFHLSEAGYEPIIINDLNLCEPLSYYASYLGENKMLISSKIAKNINFIGFEQIIVPNEEISATKAITVNGTLIIASGYRETSAALKAKGIRFEEVNISELEKAGLNMKSLSLTMHLLQGTGDITLPLASSEQVVA